jgi:putative nucleotidyltransferase with HDIG domain
MLPHIVDHSMMVARVAEQLTDLLVPDNPDLKPDLILAAAMLHDITKTRSFTTGERHAQTGGRVLEEMGYPEVGEVVRQHVILDVYRSGGAVTEAEIVNYADKRVLHDRVVPLALRLAYILERYGITPDNRVRIRTLWHDTVLLEERLFRGLPLTPEQLGV